MIVLLHIMTRWLPFTRPKISPLITFHREVCPIDGLAEAGRRIDAEWHKSLYLLLVHSLCTLSLSLPLHLYSLLSLYMTADYY